VLRAIEMVVYIPYITPFIRLCIIGFFSIPKLQGLESIQQPFMDLIFGQVVKDLEYVYEKAIGFTWGSGKKCPYS